MDGESTAARRRRIDMERLTKKKTVDGWGEISYVDGDCCYDPFEDGEEAFAGEAIDRLAAYEDTMTLERAQELAQAEKAGRLMVLLCKVGYVVYLPPISRNDGICSARVTRIEITMTRMERDLLLCLDLGDGRQKKFRWASDKGRTWFLSKKEAEEALRKEAEHG